MDISINQEFTGIINEDYSGYENDDVSSIFGAISKIIDDLKIASFSVLFKKWDERFKHTDFAYDFTSIGTELTGLIHFLEKPVDEYSLGFYELDRKVIFELQNQVLIFRICPFMNGELLFKGSMDFSEFKEMILKLLKDFEALLVRFFPKAYKIFVAEKYIFY